MPGVDGRVAIYQRSTPRSIGGVDGESCSDGRTASQLSVAHLVVHGPGLPPSGPDGLRSPLLWRPRGVSAAAIGLPAKGNGRFGGIRRRGPLGSQHRCPDAGTDPGGAWSRTRTAQEPRRGSAELVITRVFPGAWARASKPIV